MLHTDLEKPEKASRTERLEARLNSEQKDLLERAAALQGRSLSAFVLASAEEAAIKTIQDHDTIKLVGRNRDAFVAALLEPPRPSKKLRAAAAQFKKDMGL
jgi:uncharacterized protein (DUF1778 family)